MKKQEGYLFVYFTGESEDGEQIYFAVSKDGLHCSDDKWISDSFFSDVRAQNWFSAI